MEEIKGGYNNMDILTGINLIILDKEERENPLQIAEANYVVRKVSKGYLEVIKDRSGKLVKEIK